MDLEIGSLGCVADKTDSLRGPRSSGATTASIELHIEELVLHGFPASDRFRIGDAVEQELARLITEQGLQRLGTSGVDIERLDAGSFQVARGAKAEAIGFQLARHLHPRLAPGQMNQRKERPK